MVARSSDPDIVSASKPRPRLWWLNYNHLVIGNGRIPNNIILSEDLLEPPERAPTMDLLQDTMLDKIAGSNVCAEWRSTILVPRLPEFDLCSFRRSRQNGFEHSHRHPVPLRKVGIILHRHTLRDRQKFIDRDERRVLILVPALRRQLS